MEILIIFLPFLGAFGSLVYGKSLGNVGIVYSTVIFLYFSLMLTVYSFFIFLKKGVFILNYSSWFSCNLLSINWCFYFDTLTYIMLFIVLFISLMVHLFSVIYMLGDPHRGRFMCCLSFFTFFMLILVTAGNFIQLFVGWEGVGVCSYILISFWFTRGLALNSALKAMVINRIGDVGLLLAMAFIYLSFFTFDFTTIFSAIYNYRLDDFEMFTYLYNYLDLISFFIMIGAIGKSAQFGLHSWLPDAMEGPTPVSALIHAATMVTAGVFVIIRCSPIIEFSYNCLFFMSIIGAITALFGSITGLFQNDIKKIIAYSTCSQLGYMFFSCGLSNYNIAMFHLTGHAFFKALLFLGAGAFIHSFQDKQDLRFMGGAIYLFPVGYISLVIGGLSLIGFPFLTGFYSKDILLENSCSLFTISGVVCFWIGTISALLTAYYTFRIFYLVFFNSLLKDIKLEFKKLSYIFNFFELKFLIYLVFISLIFGSMFFGFLFKDNFIGAGTDFWDISIFVLPNHVSGNESEYLPWSYKIFPVFLSILGGFIAIFFNKFLFISRYVWSNNVNFTGLFLFNLFSQKWFFDFIVVRNIKNLSLFLSYQIIFKNIDKGFLEYIGPYGLSIFFKNFYDLVSKFHTGLLYNIVFIFIISIIFLISFIIFSIYNFVDMFLYLVMLSVIGFFNYKFTLGYII